MKTAPPGYARQLRPRTEGRDGGPHGGRFHFEPDIPVRAGKFHEMSATEIINELPKLTETERRAVRQKLLELAAEHEDVALCNQAALEGAMMLDRMEEDDALERKVGALSPSEMDRVLDALAVRLRL